MNTHDIELPEHDCLYESTNEQGYIDLEPAYRKTTVLKLIEADRQRRGEPVAYIRTISFENGEAQKDLMWVSQVGDLSGYRDFVSFEPLCLPAPQPAEPVVKHSLTDAEPVKVTQRHDLGFIRSDSAMNAEPVKHPSYDADCCQGHTPNSDCKCAAYDADPSVTPQEEEAWQQMERRK